MSMPRVSQVQNQGAAAAPHAQFINRMQGRQQPGGGGSAPLTPTPLMPTPDAFRQAYPNKQSFKQAYPTMSAFQQEVPDKASFQMKYPNSRPPAASQFNPYR
jgi:hypothetical protein